jgi:hypothetical protein
MSANLTDFFVELSEAHELKDLGFKENSLGHYWGVTLWMEHTEFDKMPYVGWVLAPTFEHAFDWIRRTHKMDCSVHSMDDGSFTFDITDYPYSEFLPTGKPDIFEDSKGAKTQCLKRMIELAKRKL